MNAGTELVPRPSAPPPDLELLKRTIAKGTTDDEFALFASVCRRTGLDPFTRQIYALKRRERQPDGSYAEALSIQVSIDGLRLIAERTGHYAGQAGPWWCGPDGSWHEVWLEEGPPAAAKVTVKKLISGVVTESSAVARWASYVQTTKDGKQELSGLYTTDEMDQATRFGSPQHSTADLRTGEIVDVGEITPSLGEAMPIDDIDSLSARQIADALRARGLEDSGSKTALRDRLAGALANDGPRGQDNP